MLDNKEIYGRKICFMQSFNDLMCLLCGSDIVGVIIKTAFCTYTYIYIILLIYICIRV